MRSKFTLLILALCSMFGMKAQLMFTENFNSTASVTADGWIKINNSSPVGSTSWFMGNPSTFTAYNGADSAYYAANYNSTTGNSGTISTWLISPVTTLSNNAVFQFATRTNTASTVSPDRLEVYTSSGTLATVASLTTYTNLILSVNPNLTTTGYPNTWTVYTATLSGFTGTTTGRFGFRYYVTSAGPAGANSSYIGIDNVVYSIPCSNPTLAISSSTNGICSGSAVTYSASGANTYTWSSGQNTPSVALSPTASSVYTLTGSSIPNCNSSQTVAVTVTLTPVVSALDATVCAGTAATLIASGAPSYSWSTGATTSSVIVTPTMATTYTVTGYNGNCGFSKTVSVALGASLSVNATSDQTIVCVGSPAILMGTGASNYTWTGTGVDPSTMNLPNTSVSPSIAVTYTLSASSGTCLGLSVVTVSVKPLPAVGITSSTSGTIACINALVTYTASGANTYSWLTNSSVSNSVTITTPLTAGIYTFGVVGTATNGCSRTAVSTLSLDVCTGIATISGNSKGISVYPNPFTSELKINGFTGHIEIYDALGQIVRRENILMNAEPMNTATLAKGLYILKAYSDENEVLGTVKILRN